MGVIEDDLLGDSSSSDSSDEEVKDVFDLVLFCQPPGSNFDGSTSWIAWAYINGYQSSYNDEWCQSLSGQMHEVGHNLGLGHSGYGRDEYADTSGYMGYSNLSSEFPRKCYNGHKSYELGWYPNQMGSIDPLDLDGGSQDFMLIGIADYDSSSSSSDSGDNNVFVTLKLEYEGDEGGLDWYINFNNADDEINPDSTFGKNSVFIIEREEVYNNYGNSFTVGVLEEGDSHTLNLGGTTVKILVNEVDDSEASITITSGTGTSVRPTRRPTKRPTKRPTRRPTRRPTKSPSS